VTDRSAIAWIVVATSPESLFVVSPSAVPVELTWALLWTTVPSATEAETLTWIVNVVVPPTARVAERLQVTSWPIAVQSVLGWNVVPAGSVSVTVIPPVWTYGPWLVTVRV